MSRRVPMVEELTKERAEALLEDYRKRGRGPGAMRARQIAVATGEWQMACNGKVYPPWTREKVEMDRLEFRLVCKPGARH
jgi:hypothetical protein